MKNIEAQGCIFFWIFFFSPPLRYLDFFLPYFLPKHIFYTLLYCVLTSKKLMMIENWQIISFFLPLERLKMVEQVKKWLKGIIYLVIR